MVYDTSPTVSPWKTQTELRYQYPYLVISIGNSDACYTSTTSVHYENVPPESSEAFPTYIPAAPREYVDFRLPKQRLNRVLQLWDLRRFVAERCGAGWSAPEKQSCAQPDADLRVPEKTRNWASAVLRA